MNLELTAEQALLRDTFADLFAAESTPERIRSAEIEGFDEALWARLAETGALGIRVPQGAGGSGYGSVEAGVLVFEAGRRLATGPLVETIVAASLLARLGEHERLRPVLAGDGALSLVPRPLQGGESVLVAGGVRATAAIVRRGADLLLLSRPADAEPVANLGAPGLERWPAAGAIALASGNQATELFEAAVEEWKLLLASYLSGLAREAITIASRYASERIQFDRPIATFQGIAHPLADAVTWAEGARLLVWEALWAISRGRREAGALVPIAFAQSVAAATRAVRRALHTQGGYGLSLEYDAQIFFRRAKALPLLAGDPADCWIEVADRLWRGVEPSLPEVGEVPFEFESDAGVGAFRQRVRNFFAENLTDELRAHAHFSWDGHHPAFNRRLAAAGLAFPLWPREFGGQECSPYEQSALEEEFHRAGWTTHALGTTRMVGATLMRFGTAELKAEVLPRMVAGDAVSSLGYTEPGAGSDVAAAQTRALRDGDDWVINGQKMFTSGANVAQYVFLITRTNSEARKHEGLTMFLVPLDTPGIEIQAVHTLSDERTNITYYSDVRLADRYRVGEVDGGWDVLAYALELEHGGTYPKHHRDLLDRAVEWARKPGSGGQCPLDDPRVRERLGRCAAHFETARVLARQSLWAAAEKRPNRGEGPMSKLFQTEILVEDAQDLLDLAAPESLVREGEGEGSFEFYYRLSPAPAIYAGTSEIMRSIIAQRALGMPRSRS